MTITTERNPLRMMTERITAHGWTQDKLYSHGRTCLLGAAGMIDGQGANGYQAVCQDARAPGWLVTLAEVICEQYPDRVLRPVEGHLVMTIPRFNDHAFTQRKEVLAVLEKAAIRWDERVELG